MFGRIGFVYVCMCVYVAKNRLFEVLLLSVTHCSFVEFNHQKCSLCQAIHSEKEIRKHSINGMGKIQGLENLYYGKPRLF